MNSPISFASIQQHLSNGNIGKTAGKVAEIVKNVNTIISGITLTKKRTNGDNIVDISTVQRKKKNPTENKNGTGSPEGNNVIPFPERIKFDGAVPGAPVLTKQLPKMLNCSGINLQGNLEWAWGGNIPPTITGFIEKTLSPKGFAKEFNKNAPQGYTMHLQNPGNHEVLQIIQRQLKDGIPVPMIYVPIGGNVRAPHFATIVDSGKLDGKIIYRIEDSMRDVIPKKWLTEKELLECLNFQTLRSEKVAKNIALRTFAGAAQWHLGGNTIYKIEKVVPQVRTYG